jgi:ceramide glucosyltransferase
MRADLRGAASAVALGAALVSIGYTAFALIRLRAFARRPPPRPARREPITILKPVHGLEFELEQNLRTFCRQDYPEFQVVLGVLDPGDPALAVLRRVASECGDRVTVVAGDGIVRHRNPKIATLAPMLPHARHELLVVADSDMRVGPGYLDAIAAAFDDPQVGAVTCIYRGESAGDGLSSTIGAMAITEQFAPSALVATTLERMTYCFGGTMAVRRAVLDEIGGLDALGTQLADDAALGRFTAEHGHRVALAEYVAATVVDEPGLLTLVAHELRWARTIRSVRPRSYAGLILTYPLPLALVYLALARKRGLALRVVALAAAVRVALHLAAHRVMAAPRRPPLALIPLRDAVSVVVWLCGLGGNEVRWRGRELRIAADGDIAAGARDREGLR